MKINKQIKEAEKIRDDLRIADARIDYLEQGIKEVQGELKEEFKLMRSSEIINKIIDKVFKNRFGEIK